MPISLRESICESRGLPRNDAILMGRAELLSGQDRDLVEAVLVHGQSTSAVGRMTGLSARVVRRRLHRICNRLTSRSFLDVARALPYLSEADAELAQARFCRGATHMELCREFGLTWHALRRRLDKISAQIQMIHQLSRLARLSQGR